MEDFPRENGDCPHFSWKIQKYFSKIVGRLFEPPGFLGFGRPPPPSQLFFPYEKKLLSK
jgi:hypothetical protein